MSDLPAYHWMSVANLGVTQVVSNRGERGTIFAYQGDEKRIFVLVGKVLAWQKAGNWAPAGEEFAERQKNLLRGSPLETLRENSEEHVR